MKRIFTAFNGTRELSFFLLFTLAILTQANGQVGELDYSYTTGSGFNGAVNASAIDANGKLVVGGAFTSYNGTTRNYIARLNTDGTLDNTFDPGSTLGSAVLALAIESTGTILVGGSFAGVLKRLNANGTPGTLTLTGTGLGATGYVSSIAIQADNNIVVGGTFTKYDNTNRYHIARLLSTGSLDATFDPVAGFGSGFVVITSLAIQSDGKIIAIGGSSGFASYNGTSRDNIVRIEASGALDATFVPPSNLLARMYDVKIQSDGKAIVTGEYNGNTNSIFNGVARFNTNGSFDNTFTPNFFQGGRALAIQSDGKILVGGSFIKGIKRLTTAGVDDGFIPNFSSGFESGQEIKSIVVQSDGKVIASGSCGYFNGVARANITRITTCASVAVTTHPSNSTICDTNNTSFSVTATGSGLTYQWQFTTGGTAPYSNVVDGAPYSGATTNTLSIANAGIGLNTYRFRCLVSDGTCTTTSSHGLLTVNASPVINTQPQPSTICENTDATFTIAATNPGLYQWQHDLGSGFVDITVNGNSTSLTIAGAPASYNGRKYRCVLGSCNPPVISSEVLLTVNSAPVINTQPVAPSPICTGSNTQLSVVATNAATFQWQEKVPAGSFANITNGGIYGGALTNQLTLTGATVSQHNNQYRCIISGSNTCSTTSNAVVLSVYNPPSVSAHPANSTKCAGTNTTFTVAVTSPPAGLTYQWQEKIGSGSFTNLANGGVYSNVTAATLNLTGVTAAMSGNKYRCVVGTCSTPVVSFDADLIVDSPPVITLQPLASTICAGMTTTFTTNATMTGGTFKWQKETSAGSSSYADISNGGIYSGANTETLTLTNATVNESGFRYRCVITASGICTAVNTSTALLTVRDLPTFNTQPVDKTVCEGLTASFSTSVNFNNGASTYQWQVKEVGSGFIDIAPNAALYPSGANSSSLAVSPTFAMNGNKYRVRVGTCQPEIFSSEVVLTVNQAPTITAQPIDKTICKGETVSFSVTAVGSGLTYQWKWTGDGGTGGDTSTLTLTNVQPGLNGTEIYCIIKGATGCAQVQSAAATLTVNNFAITTQPVAVNPFCPGGNASYTIVAEGPSLTYQWQEDNKSGVFADITTGGIYGGATTNKLDLTGVPFTMVGYKYRCVVKGQCGELNSNSVSLGLFPIPAKPAISINTNNPEAPVLTVGNGDGYKWYKNGTLVSSSSSLTVTSEGSYTVIISSNGCQSVASDPVVIVITGDRESLRKSAIQVYPNPATDHITLTLGGFERDKPVSISIVDMQGRVMEKTSGLGQREISIDIRNYTSGKYVAWLQQRNTKVSQQFIKNDK